MIDWVALECSQHKVSSKEESEDHRTYNSLFIEGPKAARRVPTSIQHGESSLYDQHNNYNEK